jgi:hypothetical protein
MVCYFQRRHPYKVKFPVSVFTHSTVTQLLLYEGIMCDTQFPLGLSKL